MSAQAMHSGPTSCMISSSPVPPHKLQLHSFSGETTTRSGGLLCLGATIQTSYRPDTQLFMGCR